MGLGTQGFLEEETVFEEPQRVAMERGACTQELFGRAGGGTRRDGHEQMVQLQERERCRAVDRRFGVSASRTSKWTWRELESEQRFGSQTFSSHCYIFGHGSDRFRCDHLRRKYLH